MTAMLPLSSPSSSLLPLHLTVLLLPHTVTYSRIIQTTQELPFHVLKVAVLDLCSFHMKLNRKQV